jgi:hypothetical protein
MPLLDYKSRLRAAVALLVATTPLFAQGIKLVRIPDASSVVLTDGTHTSLTHVGARFGRWTLMAIAGDRASAAAFAVIEDFSSRTGHLRVIDQRGTRLDLAKSLEPTWTTDPSKLYFGHSLKEVIGSPSDLLGDTVLARPGDPDYHSLAPVLPPVRKMDTYTFLGTPQTVDKVPFSYGGRSPDIDPAQYDRAIDKLRDAGHVLDGLVGGWLPILRFVYPESPTQWTEMIAFAPFRIPNGNDRIQPVWYRIVHVEKGSVVWTRYIDSYSLFPPRTRYDPRRFYRDLLALQAGWSRMLAPAMQLDLPDKRLQNMARFSLVREMMTRIGNYPKYGVVDRNYGASEHDGFPDTFTVDTAAMLQWGLIGRAGRYIDNYLEKFVRDDGSLLYRGPETGQYGQMLTVLAQYANYGGNPALLLRHRKRIDAITRLLLRMRAKAKQLPRDHPAYGMLAGWSEADSSLDSDPARYMQPYFSNSTEAARGLRDLGRTWIRIGKHAHSSERVRWGQHLVRESTELRSDIQTAIARSLLHADGETILPAIAGVKRPFDVAVSRDPADPQFRSYRAYTEMMYSGLLTRREVEDIVDYRRTHHDLILGIPTAYGYDTGDLAGFLAWGYGYGLIQYGNSRQALLLLYAIMAHQYTRGTWTAPETRPVFNDTPAAPYCAPAQLVVPLLTKWILVFDDPRSDTVWFGKAMPERWLEDGKRVSIRAAPTRFGRVSYFTISRLAAGRVEAQLELPAHFAATAAIRLRVPGGRKLEAVVVNGAAWQHFTADGTITIPPAFASRVWITASY